MPEDETPFPWSLNPGDYLERKSTWFIILCLSGGFLLILMLLTITMRNRVAIAIELIEEGSVACSQMLSTLFFPPLPFVLQGNDGNRFFSLFFTLDTVIGLAVW